MIDDARRPAVQAKAQGNVIIDPLAGERAQQDDEREQRDQQARAEQHGLIGEVQGLQPLQEALREGSFEPVPSPRQRVVPGTVRWRCLPLRGRLPLLAVGLHHHAAPSGASGYRRNRMALVNLEATTAVLPNQQTRPACLGPAHQESGRADPRTLKLQAATPSTTRRLRCS